MYPRSKDNQDVASLRYSVKDPLDLLVRWSRVSDNKRLLQVAFEKKRFKVSSRTNSRGEGTGA
jgi:hypothetical protein